MDHLIIQRGSLAQQNRAPTLQEMNTIVQFGAQQVLKSTEDKIEEDIDKILEYAHNKTYEMNNNAIIDNHQPQSSSDGWAMVEGEGVQLGPAVHDQGASR